MRNKNRIQKLLYANQEITSKVLPITMFTRNKAKSNGYKILADISRALSVYMYNHWCAQSGLFVIELAELDTC